LARCRGNVFEARGDVDAVADVNPDAELDAPIRRQAIVPHLHLALHFDRATHRGNDRRIRSPSPVVFRSGRHGRKRRDRSAPGGFCAGPEWCLPRRAGQSRNSPQRRRREWRRACVVRSCCGMARPFRRMGSNLSHGRSDWPIRTWRRKAGDPPADRRPVIPAQPPFPDQYHRTAGYPRTAFFTDYTSILW
jgi:hypothetical protein